MERQEFGGHVEVIAGGMFSGKSEELLRRLRRAIIAKQRVQVFQPVADTRASNEKIVTRDNRDIEAISVSNSDELRRRLELGVEVVAVDEAQFFDQGLVDLVNQLADLGVRVIVAGLDQDYLRRPFGPLPLILATAEYVDKMHAICVRCGSPAHYSQRIAGGDEQLQVGDSESYEARCRGCYEVFRGTVVEQDSTETPSLASGSFVGRAMGDPAIPETDGESIRRQKRTG